MLQIIGPLRYIIQICSAARFALARDIDPAYGLAFDRARKAGVEAYAWRCNIACAGLDLAGPVPILAQPTLASAAPAN